MQNLAEQLMELKLNPDPDDVAYSLAAEQPETKTFKPVDPKDTPADGNGSETSDVEEEKAQVDLPLEKLVALAKVKTVMSNECEEGSACAICHVALNKRKSVREVSVLSCQHFFHKACVYRLSLIHI